jgi:hypothetical protein
MTSSNSTVSITQESKLPRRDLLVLPLLSLITIFALAISTELATNWLFPVSQSGLEECFAKEDLSGDARTIPNSVCSERILESRFLAEYRFNSWGFRANTELTQKRPGTYRIVMIGSSIAMGLFVPRELTFAAILPNQLSMQTGRKVEIYNEATGGRFRGGYFPKPGSTLHFDQALSADPDMILWIVTPADVQNLSVDSAIVTRTALPDVALRGTPTYRKATAWSKLTAAVADGSLGRKLRSRWEQTTVSSALKHVLYGSESQGQYIRSYLKNEDDAGFLKTEQSENWQRRLAAFQTYADDFERQARAAGVPLVAVLVPNRAQTAMISVGEWPAGYDPYKLDNELREIIQSHGGTYIDILPDFRAIPNPEQHYFPVDGHPDADGHAMISRLLAKELTSGAVPSLTSVPPQVASAKGR